MFKKVNQLAEGAATNVSRRGFLGRLGRGTALISGVVGGLLVTAESVSAGKSGGQLYYCVYENGIEVCDYRCKGTLSWKDRFFRKTQKTSLVSKTPVDTCPL